ncbi:MAG: TraR/DksA family transcriptional regulator [Acidobacteriota bacterium]
MREGTYGVCQRCDELISTARLKAIPWTSFCIRCQQELDEVSSEYFPHAA